AGGRRRCVLGEPRRRRPPARAHRADGIDARADALRADQAHRLARHAGHGVVVRRNGCYFDIVAATRRPTAAITSLRRGAGAVVCVSKAHTTIGARPGGQTMPTSLVLPRLPVPVLSP